jgi:hypothetical protein
MSSKSIDTLGADFVRRHEWLLAMIKDSEVAICGGCAAAIGKDRSDYVPADLDLVATKGGALRLLDNINHFLLKKEVHFRVYANSRNSFVPSPAIGHFRIQCPFWVPVCLFVLPDDKLRFYRIKGGHMIQLPSDVKQAADALTETDHKPRLANEPVDDLDLDVFDQDEPDEVTLTFISPNAHKPKAGSGNMFDSKEGQPS